MFDISFTELMLVGLVALVVIGPERLPKVAKTVGHLLGRAQRYVNDVKGDIQREVELDELRKMKDDMESAARSMQSSMQQTESKLRKEFQSPVDDFKGELDELKGDFEDQVKTEKPAATAPQTSAESKAEPHAEHQPQPTTEVGIQMPSSDKTVSNNVPEHKS
ncbi:MAG TPA: Sec-independent protein translocase protein TatB [Orrella sp.]